MVLEIIVFWHFFSAWMHQILKRWTKPIAKPVIVGALSDLSRNRTDLIIENAILRQQLIVLTRQIKRPQLTHGDRLGLVLLARFTKFWKQALHIVEPDTLLRWHRDIFRFYWKRKSKPKKKEPIISPETIHLIKQMANENRLWGAERIRGELLKLGIQVSKRTIQRYLPKERKTSTQAWTTFLKNHASEIWACDFTVVHDLLFRPIVIFVILELKTRLIIHSAVTTSPSDEWTAQQLREATPWSSHPKYLIRDHDRKYGFLFSSLAASSGIQEMKTPFQAPKANAVCERFMGSLKRECLDHTFMLNQRQLERLVKDYVIYYNTFRPHQGIQQRIPERYEKKVFPIPIGKIVSRPILGGLHHDYTRTAYLN
ncbi:MAG: integrase core domain-containing protein [Anaerolineales bacterium]